MHHRLSAICTVQYKAAGFNATYIDGLGIASDSQTSANIGGSADLKVRLQYGQVIRVFSSYSLYALLLNASIASALVGRAMSVTSDGG